MGLTIIEVQAMNAVISLSRSLERIAQRQDEDRTLILGIQQAMSGVEWNADTLNRIARLMNRAGYHIKDLSA